jgi:hypothetical protein
MAEDVRHTWNKEKWVIDRLIEAVEAGDTGAKPSLGQRLLDGIWNDGWTAWECVEEGLYLPLKALDPANLSGEDLDCLCEEGVVSVAREPEICSGAALQGRELQRWHEIVVERAFAPEVAVSWAIFEMHRGRRSIYVAATLTQPSPESPIYNMIPTFVAAYETFTEVLNALKSKGFLGRKDYEVRSGEVFGAK